MKKPSLLLAVLLFTPALFAQQNVSVPQKFALVIGNSNYTGMGRLNNPVNDANDMEAALKGLGFTVEKLLDADRMQMENAVTQLKNSLSRSRNTYGFFFYAGHGVQSQGVNYLIPVNAQIPSEQYLPDRGVPVQAILKDLSDAGNELNMIVLDACRDNPFSWARSGSRGLTVESAPIGSIVVFATSANAAAADGTGRNGLFTTQLLKNLKTPSLNVLEVFSNTGQDVLNASSGKQHPEISIRYFQTAYFGSRPVPQQAATPASQPTPPPTPQATTTAQPQPTPAATQTPRPAVIVTPASPDEDRPVKPEMIRINGGTFTMGGDGYPSRQVKISSFYMGNYEVTQKEYNEIMGTNSSQFLGDNLPAERVSWFDAVEYCNKRSQKEGLIPAYTIKGTGNSRTVKWNRKANGYRLPTEAEWEYACRAGTKTAYNTGTIISDNTGWYSDNSGGRTHTVGQKPANAWGLHDMHGNVFEWCWDWYGNYPSRAQTDPAGASSGSYRVRRGGSWSDSAEFVHSAYRYYFYPIDGLDYIGFRLVRNAQ